MFESICIKHQSNINNSKSLDLGFLAEALIFYSDVLILAKEDTLEQLINGFGPEILLEYLESGFLRVKYEYHKTGISSHDSGASNNRYSPLSFYSPNHSLQNITPKLFADATGRSGRGRRLGLRFSKFVKEMDSHPAILTDFTSDVLDNNYVINVVKNLLRIFAPEYKIPDPLIFNVFQDNKEFVVETNLNYIEANKSYNIHIPPSHSSLSNASILFNILATRENLLLASTQKADLSLDELNSQLLTTKVSGILDGYNSNLNRIQLFQDFVVDDGKAIREMINNGQRSFSDLFQLLEKAQEFKKWLRDKPQDVNLIKSYFKDVTQESWIDRLPAKSFRWSFFTGAGLLIDVLGGGGIGTTVGVGVSAADTFILDKLVKGWKPNHFIEGQLIKFVNK